MPHYASGDHLFITDKQCASHPDFIKELILEGSEDVMVIDRWESKGFIKVYVRIVSSDASPPGESGSQGGS